MRPALVKKLRRLMIGIMMLVVISVLANYLLVRRSRNSSGQKAPPVLSSDMMRSAEGFRHTDYKDGVPQFRIDARRLLETREGKSYLEGISANDFNPDGSVRNEIRSRSAVYDQKGKLVDFAGDVRLFLGRDVELQTDSLHYDLNTNIASTRDPLKFYSSQGSGTARGIRFNQQEGILELGGDVDFILIRKSAFPGGTAEPGEIRAASDKAVFFDRMHRIVFEGAARIESDEGTLTGNRIELLLSRGQKNVTKLTAAGTSAYRSKNPDDSWTLMGDQMVFDIGETETLERIYVSEQALFSSNSATRDLELSGGEIVLGFDAPGESLTDIQSRTGVELKIKSEESRIKISGEQLEAALLAETKSFESLCVRDRAAFSTGNSRDSSDNELRADEIRLIFRQQDGHSIMNKLLAAGSAQWRSTPKSKNPETPRRSARILRASTLEMAYSGDGDFIESGSAMGDVEITEAPEDGSGHNQVRSLSADSARLHFFPQNNQLRDIYAEGRVLVEYEQDADSGGNSLVEEFQASSEKIQAFFRIDNNESALQSVAQWGDFRYESAAMSATAGRCDYDAEKGTLVLKLSPKITDKMGVTTAKEMKYDQKLKIMSAHGTVHSLLNSSNNGGTFFAASSSSIIIAADEMQYWPEDERIRYIEKAQLLSESQQLQAQELEVFGGGERMKARGNVLHYIHRISGSQASEKTSAGESKHVRDSRETPIVIKSKNVQYQQKDNAIRYTGDVHLASDDLELFSDSFDAFWNSEGSDIEHAAAQGNILVRRAGKECRGDTADWYMDSGKFVVQGNPAEFYDAGHIRSKAARLTFFTTDDTIQLEGR
jgi:LPS export ABC transporter protein LptC